MDPKKYGGQVENSFQAEKSGLGGLMFYQKIYSGPSGGPGFGTQKEGPKSLIAPSPLNKVFSP